MENWAYKDRHISFDGLSFGHDRPSDIDGIMVRPDSLIIIESKCGDIPLKPKQAMVMETLVDNAEKAGKKSIAIIARYYDRDPKNEVTLAHCRVSEFYTKGKWYRVEFEKTLRQTMEQFLA
jgi:hypothetical protein